MLQLHGEGLVLREWTDADLAAMSELFDETSIDDRTPLRSPFDLDAARGYLARAHAAPWSARSSDHIAARRDQATTTTTTAQASMAYDNSVLALRELTGVIRLLLKEYDSTSDS